MLEKSGMFKKIKSIFIVEGPDAVLADKKQTENVSDSPSKASAKSHQSTEYKPEKQVSASPISSDTKPDVKFTDLLLKAIEANNMEGFDYLEFKNSLKSLESVIPEEGMRYKSAYEMAKTMGLSKEKLVQSANHYINILTSEDKKFKDALSNQRAKQVQARADQVSSIEKSILDKQKMIENLNKEIETSKKQLEAVREEINSAVVKIDTTNQQFVASFNLVYGQIEEDIQKIKQNL